MLLARLQTQRSFVFSQLFDKKISLRALIATFLAVLELTRLKKLRLQQDETFSDIVCTAVEENPLASPAELSTVSL
jgi:segregation and condensation protein A